MNIAYKYNYLAILIVFLVPASGSAQFLNIQIDVEPEVEVSVQEPLNFGAVMTNAGYISIPPGSPGMGTFRIRALNAQSLLMEIDYPQYLTHNSPNVEDRIPIQLEASFNNNGVDDVQSSESFTTSGQEVTIVPPPQSPNANWSALLVYVYGGITVGNVETGAYYGEIVLTIMYN